MARQRITNTSGEKRHFGWIPPHGRDLEDNESVIITGDLESVLASGRNRYSRSQELAALEADKQAGNVVLEDLADTSSSSAAP